MARATSRPATTRPSARRSTLSAATRPPPPRWPSAPTPASARLPTGRAPPPSWPWPGNCGVRSAECGLKDLSSSERDAQGARRYLRSSAPSRLALRTPHSALRIQGPCCPPPDLPLPADAAADDARYPGGGRDRVFLLSALDRVRPRPRFPQRVHPFPRSLP